MLVSLSTARRLALYRQGLDGRLWLPSGKEGVAQLIDRLGYVQIDTIAVVQRAHHHTIWVRRPDYDPQMLYELQAHDRRVFEWWAPAMSYVPMHDYRFYAPQAGNIRSWHRQWYQENKPLVSSVLDRIRQEGSLGAADFEAPEGFERGTWWSWKPAKQALEVLFDMGELMVSERRNFQRIFDLRERVLPAEIDTSFPSAEEKMRFEIRRVLGGLGVVGLEDIGRRRWFRVQPSAAVVQEMADAGEITFLQIEGREGETFCALADTLKQVVDQPVPAPLVHILSPFDNLVIRRDWLQALFGFDYRLEAYTPAAKRQYGYFTLPIVWGTEFAGRVDAKADRKARALLVRRLTFEPEFAAYETLLPALAARLHDLAAANGCQDVVVEQVDPVSVQAPLVHALAGEG